MNVNQQNNGEPTVLFWLFIGAMLLLFFIGVALVLRGGLENYVGAAAFLGAFVTYVIS